MFRFQISFIGSVDVVNSFMDMCTSFYIYIFQRLIQFPADNVHLTRPRPGQESLATGFNMRSMTKKIGFVIIVITEEKLLRNKYAMHGKNEYLSVVISICGYEI